MVNNLSRMQSIPLQERARNGELQEETLAQELQAEKIL